MSHLAFKQHTRVAGAEAKQYELGALGHSRALPLFLAATVPGVKFSTPVGHAQMARTHGSVRSRKLKATGKEGVKTIPHKSAKHAQGKLSSAKDVIGWAEHEIEELVYEDDGEGRRVRPAMYAIGAVAVLLLLFR